MAIKVPTFAEAQAALNKYTVRLDCIDPSDPGFNDFLRENNIEMNVISMDGPGHCPDVSFNGTKEALTQMIAEQYTPNDPEETKFLCGMIRRV